MALPTLRPLWVKSFKNNVEISSRQIEKQEDLRSRWNQNYSYFKAAELNASKNSAWTSDRSFKRSMNAVDKLFSKEIQREKFEELFNRRQKLRELLMKENQQYEIELKERRQFHGKDFRSMQERVDRLQAEKEEKRKQVAHRKLHEHWRLNEPRLREAEFERNKQHVATAWKDQVDEKEEEEKFVREQEKRFDDLSKEENEAALSKEKLVVKEIAFKNKTLAQELREQMALLRKKEEETEMLKVEEGKLRHHTEDLLKAEGKRQQFNDHRRKREFGRVLIRQYKQQLKQKSKEVQEALEFDLKILAEIAAKEKDEEVLKLAQKEKLRSDADYMQQVVADQLRLEKTREAELDMLFHEDASRQWQKRESEWERERLARERLMKTVFEERQQQIAEKMEKVRLKQQETIEEQEFLLEQMEEHQMLTHREEHERLGKRRQREKEIHDQITARETEREYARWKEQEDLQRRRLEEKEYEKMLMIETNRLTTQDSTAPQTSFRRKKVAFL